MNRRGAMLGSFVFFCVAPATVAGWIPWVLTRWHRQPAFFGVRALASLGTVLIGAGGGILVESFVRFARRGLGTPAPVAPTELLVVSGLYRYVRNPMYLGVFWDSSWARPCFWEAPFCWNTALSSACASFSSWFSTRSRASSADSGRTTIAIGPTFRGGGQGLLLGDNPSGAEQRDRTADQENRDRRRGAHARDGYVPVV